MSLINFFALAIVVFLVVTVIGICICYKKRGGAVSASIAIDSDELKLANAIPSTNDYENFDNILKIVLTEYPQSYKAAGQVYNNYE